MASNTIGCKKRARPSEKAEEPAASSVYVEREDPTESRKSGPYAGGAGLGSGGEYKTTPPVGVIQQGRSSSDPPPKRRPSLDKNNLPDIINPAKSNSAGGFASSQERSSSNAASKSREALMAPPETLSPFETHDEEIIITPERAETDSFLHASSNYPLQGGLVRRGSHEWHG